MRNRRVLALGVSLGVAASGGVAAGGCGGSEGDAGVAVDAGGLVDAGAGDGSATDAAGVNVPRGGDVGGRGGPDDAQEGDGADGAPLVDAAAPADVAAADAGSADADGAAVDAFDPGPRPPTQEERGFVAARAALHVHSAWSHDACDGVGIAEDGTLNAPCVARLRAAMCSAGFDFVLLTDHPAHMSDQPFFDLLHADPAQGDVVVTDDAGEPVANVLACDGPAGPRPVVVRVGFEGTHTMPVALGAHLSPLELEKVSLRDETPAADRTAVVDAIHAVGGVAVVAHSEEEELSGATIAALPIEAMELYNFHANFNAILSAAPERLIEMESFLDPAPGGPDPDLVALTMLDVFPEPLETWGDVEVGGVYFANGQYYQPEPTSQSGYPELAWPVGLFEVTNWKTAAIEGSDKVESSQPVVDTSCFLIPSPQQSSPSTIVLQSVSENYCSVLQLATKLVATPSALLVGTLGSGGWIRELP